MRANADHHECIAVCVDDLMFASEDPETIVMTLVEKQQFKLKGTGPAEFHLCCDFFH